MRDDYDNEVPEDEALTLVFADRCICLQAPNPVTRDLWGVALNYLIKLKVNYSLNN